MSNRETKSTTLDELKKICDAATKGPWYPTMIRRMNGESHTVDDDEQSICKVLSEKPIDDKYFIAIARTEMPKLVKALQWAKAFFERNCDCKSVALSGLPCMYCYAKEEIDALLSEGTKTEDK